MATLLTVAKAMRSARREVRALLAYAHAVGKLTDKEYRRRSRALSDRFSSHEPGHYAQGLPQPGILHAAADTPPDPADRLYVGALVGAEDRGGREGGWWLSDAIANARSVGELRAVLAGFFDGAPADPAAYPELAAAMARRERWQHAWLERSAGRLSKAQYRAICEQLTYATDPIPATAPREEQAAPVLEPSGPASLLALRQAANATVAKPPAPPRPTLPPPTIAAPKTPPPPAAPPVPKVAAPKTPPPLPAPPVPTFGVPKAPSPSPPAQREAATLAAPEAPSPLPAHPQRDLARLRQEAAQAAAPAQSPITPGRRATVPDPPAPRGAPEPAAGSWDGFLLRSGAAVPDPSPPPAPARREAPWFGPDLRSRAAVPDPSPPPARHGSPEPAGTPWDSSRLRSRATVPDPSPPARREAPEPAAAPWDGSHLRISHRDRERAGEALAAALSDGRLSPAEYGSRVQSVHAAKTYGDLLPLVRHLDALASDAERAQVIRAVEAAGRAGALDPAEKLDLLHAARAATTDAELLRLSARLRSLLHGIEGPLAHPRLARVADADRDRVVRRLQTAIAEGRLTLDEYDERVRQTYAARRFADFEAIVGDLPEPDESPTIDAG